MRAYFGLAAAVILGLAGLAQAGPFDAKEVSGDAKWAAHLDVDALHASSLAKKAREQIFKEHPQIEAMLAAARNLFRFDPMTDLHGITIYGTQLKKDTGVAIIRAKVDQKLLTDLVKANPTYEATTYGKFELHTWQKDADKLNHAAFFKADVIVFGASIEELKAAIDVLDGTKGNISQAYASLAPAIPPGTILIAGAKDLAEANLHPESPLSKQIDSALLVVGENQGQVGEVFVRAVLNVKDAETAKRIKAVADGALALAALAKSDDADAMKLLGGMKVTVADKSVNVEGRAAVDLLWNLMQKEIAKKKAEHQHNSRLSD
jgi:hypothetical protein